MAKKKATTPDTLNTMDTLADVPVCVFNSDVLCVEGSSLNCTGCTRGVRPELDLGSVDYGFSDFIEVEEQDSEPMGLSGMGSSALGSGVWYPAPKSYDILLIVSKLSVLSAWTTTQGLYTLSEAVHVDETRYPYVFIRRTVGGIKGFMRGVTLEISSRPKDDRVWVVGTPAHDDNNGDMVIGNGSITVNGGFHGAMRYPADSRLDGTFIRSEYYPYIAMPMADAVRLCKTYKPGTRIDSMSLYRKMLALCPREVLDI